MHPVVPLVQALAKHIEQLVALPDELRETTLKKYRQLCDSCCHTMRASWQCTSPRSGARERTLLRVCSELVFNWESVSGFQPTSPWESRDVTPAGMACSCTCSKMRRPQESARS
jgi:hypothetical protein